MSEHDREHPHFGRPDDALKELEKTRWVGGRAGAAPVLLGWQQWQRQRRWRRGMGRAVCCSPSSDSSPTHPNRSHLVRSQESGAAGPVTVLQWGEHADSEVGADGIKLWIEQVRRVKGAAERQV